MQEAGAAGVDAAGEEGHADAAVVGDALKSADEVCAFEVLYDQLESTGAVGGGGQLEEDKPSNHESTGPSTHQEHRYRRTDSEYRPSIHSSPQPSSRNQSHFPQHPLHQRRPQLNSSLCQAHYKLL